MEEALYLGQKIVILSAGSGSISNVIDNPLFGVENVRGQEKFFQMGLKLREIIKKDWEQAWES